MLSSVNDTSGLNLHYGVTVSCTKNKFRVYKNAARNIFTMNKAKNSGLTSNLNTTFTRK